MLDVDIERRVGNFRLSVAFRCEAPVVGLFGRSGAGKTSVIEAIAGTTRLSRGRIAIDGTTLYDSARGIDLPPEARRIGYVFQEGLLFPHLDVAANLRYGYRLSPHAERRIEPPQIIELLGLGSLLQRRPARLSGGEKQRVAIGRALLSQPRVLLMDEPLASLDAQRRNEVLDYVDRLREELRIPIVYVSHSVAEITRLADTVVLLANGKVLAAGDVHDVMSRVDLRPHTGRYEAGSVMETSVADYDPTFGLTVLRFDGGELVVPSVGGLPGERVRVRIRARDVALALAPPTDISILNVLPARVTAIVEDDGPIVEVVLRVGSASMVARITRRSRAQLALREGQSVFALIKAVSIDRRSVGYA